MVNSRGKRPTLRSLAAKLGLGVSTVSQALRDSSEIAVETRKRVKLAAEEAGYVPNRAGVRLRTGKTNIISLVLNAEDDGSGFFTNMIYGISDALAGTPYHLVVTPYSLEDPMEPMRYIAETHSADGIILSRTVPDDPRVRFLSAANIPFVTHGRTDMGLVHSYCDFDNHAYVCEALRLLRQRGRNRAVLFGPPPNLTYARHTLAGFEDGLKAAGPDFDRQKVIDGINEMTDYTADGLVSGVDWTSAHTTRASTSCSAILKIESSEFVPVVGEEGTIFTCFDIESGTLEPTFE